MFNKNNPPPGFYVYLYLREDGTPYYVGKGKDKRAWAKHNVNLPKDYSKIVFIAKNLLESEAHILETKVISIYGRKDIGTGILRNLTDGGEGSTGWVPSVETLENIKKSRTGQFKGLTYEEIYGEDTAKNLKKIRAKQMSDMRQKQLENGVPNYWEGRGKPKNVIDAIIKARKDSIGKFFWITNEEHSTKHPVNEPIPDGYRKGRVWRQRKQEVEC